MDGNRACKEDGNRQDSGPYYVHLIAYFVNAVT